jgi:hypothetical protein
VVALQLLDGPLPAAVTPGIPCALDAPGGTRVEQGSDANGRVRFFDVDWSLGRATVTCAWPWGAASLVSFGPELMEEATGDGIYFWQWRATSYDDTVDVEGQLLSFGDPAHDYLVSTPVGVAAGQGDLYLAPAPVGQLFSLLALEVERPPPSTPDAPLVFHRWGHASSSPLSAPAIIDIDMALPAGHAAANVHVALPAVADSALAKPVGAWGSSDHPLGQFSFQMGFTTWAGLDPSTGDVRFDIEYADGVAPEDEVVSTFLVSAADGSYALVARPGFPASIVLDEPFIEPPRWLNPPQEGDPVVGATLKWDTGGTRPQRCTLTEAGWSWHLEISDPAATQLVVPALPSGVQPPGAGAPLGTAFQVVGPYLPGTTRASLARSVSIPLVP